MKTKLVKNHSEMQLKDTNKKFKQIDNYKWMNGWTYIRTSHIGLLHGK